MIQVEERPLRALEEDFLAGRKGVVQVDDRVRDERPQRFTGGEVGGFHLLEVDRLGAEGA